MSILCDRTLLRRGVDLVAPFSRGRVQPSSIDLTLGHVFRVPDRQQQMPIHINGFRVPENLTEPRTLGEGEAFVLHTGEFVLAQTAEVVMVPKDLVCHLDGKSSLGRLGLVVHATAGYVDPGFEGVLTLEMANFFPVPLVLHPGQPVCQVRFETLDERCVNPYNGRYQGDREAAGSRYGDIQAFGGEHAKTVVHPRSWAETMFG